MEYKGTRIQLATQLVWEESEKKMTTHNSLWWCSRLGLCLPKLSQLSSESINVFGFGTHPRSSVPHKNVAQAALMLTNSFSSYTCSDCLPGLPQVYLIPKTIECSLCIVNVLEPQRRQWRTRPPIALPNSDWCYHQEAQCGDFLMKHSSGVKGEACTALRTDNSNKTES